ncbi:unannotated protein [freshwater metagenome]|uniref:Unannotated protein n=1 Tax=freshwater metagenome TaxID=449393 RepID=A0A6J7DZ81_9ZZZZ|nr:SDR family NAD(P)-dependent oxidoreductase [Actinomycetota bacterium]
MTLTACITGANRGIGLELSRQYLDAGWDVIATARNLDALDDLTDLAQEHPNLRIEQLDLGDQASVSAFADRLGNQPIDLLINNAGIFGPLPFVENIQKQRFGTVDFQVWADVLAVNTLGTLNVTQALVENVAASSKKLIVTLSSGAGSIGDSDRPAIAYTSSKAALNKAMTIVARTLKDRQIVVAIMCPGYVRTRMGLGGGDVEVEESVSGLRSLISGLTMADSGTFRRYNGDVIPW